MYRVIILYKSGNRIEMECEKFDAEFYPNTGDVRSITWEGAKPSPLVAGLHHIEAIWSEDIK